MYKDSQDVQSEKWLMNRQVRAARAPRDLKIIYYIQCKYIYGSKPTFLRVTVKKKSKQQDRNVYFCHYFCSTWCHFITQGHCSVLCLSTWHSLFDLKGGELLELRWERCVHWIHEENLPRSFVHTKSESSTLSRDRERKNAYLAQRFNNSNCVSPEL